MRRIYAQWNPLEQPSYGVDIFQSWRALLQPAHRPASRKKMTAYESMITMIWLPKVRSYVKYDIFGFYSIFSKLIRICVAMNGIRAEAMP